MYTDEGSDGDLSAADYTPPTPPTPEAPVGGTKKRKKYDSEIDNLTHMIQRQVDEAEHFGLVVASHLRRCPARLQGQLQALLMTTIVNFEEEVVNPQ